MLHILKDELHVCNEGPILRVLGTVTALQSIMECTSLNYQPDG